jgi:uncharacterized protein (DUF2267 family)
MGCHSRMLTRVVLPCLARRPGDSAGLTRRRCLTAKLTATVATSGDYGGPPCQPFGADEFVRRVAKRVGVEPHAAWTQVRAVLGTLEREVAEMEAIRQRLPREFDALLA